jgi:hypothetical protein
MPTTTAQKLKIKDGFTLLTVNAPSDFRNHLGVLPRGAKISADAKDYNQVHGLSRTKRKWTKS